MAIPPRRRVAGKIEIQNKKRLEKNKFISKEISKEEHDERVRILQEQGIIKFAKTKKGEK